jgi:hypothetical protein
MCSRKDYIGGMWGVDDRFSFFNEQKMEIKSRKQQHCYVLSTNTFRAPLREFEPTISCSNRRRWPPYHHATTSKAVWNSGSGSYRRLIIFYSFGNVQGLSMPCQLSRYTLTKENVKYHMYPSLGNQIIGNQAAALASFVWRNLDKNVYCLFGRLNLGT